MDKNRNKSNNIWKKVVLQKKEQIEVESLKAMNGKRNILDNRVYLPPVSLLFAGQYSQLKTIVESFLD